MTTPTAILLVLVAVTAVTVAVAVVVHLHQRRSVAMLAERQRRDLAEAIDTLTTVAGERLDAHARTGAAHLDGRKELIDAELVRMGRTLREVTDTLGRLEAERAEEVGRLGEQLQGVARSHHDLAATTGALREALASSQARGQWGERMVEDVLRAAGFVHGVNYRTQVTTRSGTRPDVTILLPRDQVVHLDVKFPLDRYLAMVEADAEQDREAHRTAFLRAVRDRVRELSGRGYIDPQDGTIDCVLLFIPNEQVFGFVNEHDPQLLDEALARKVVLCSPSTLFAVLAVIREAVDRVALERTSDRILDLLDGFRDQWERFTDAMDKVGRGLETTQRAYDALATTRRTQLERQLDRVAELRHERDTAVGEAVEPDTATPIPLRRSRSAGG
jgi:DNA recombination protein RmuC